MNEQMRYLCKFRSLLDIGRELVNAEIYGRAFTEDVKRQLASQMFIAILCMK